MPQKDTIHDIVRRALERAGWRVVSEQWMLEEDELRVFIDMAAEPTPNVQVPLHPGPIAVEVKSFRGASFMTDLHEAIGQYLLYHDKLEALDHPHTLFLAVPNRTYEAYFHRPSVARLIRRHMMRLLVVNPTRAEIETWTN
jgi:hypothetical protein